MEDKGEYIAAFEVVITIPDYIDPHDKDAIRGWMIDNWGELLYEVCVPDNFDVIKV